MRVTKPLDYTQVSTMYTCLVTRKFKLIEPQLYNLLTSTKHALLLVFLFLTFYSSITPVIKHQQWQHATKEHMHVNKILLKKTLMDMIECFN